MAITEQNLTVAQAFQIASKHQREGRLAEAENLYRRILQAQPGSPDALVNLASLSFVRGQEAEALAIITDVLNAHPTSARAYAQRDRMIFVRERANDPQARREIAEMRRTIAAMEAEIRPSAIYVPSTFWSTLGRLHAALLEMYGMDNFKRTVVHHYQNWFMKEMTDPQVLRLLALWPTHFSSQPFMNSVEKPCDVGFHDSLSYPFYDLADSQHCDTYRLAVGLLWEYTLAKDASGKLAALAESPIGGPIAIRRQGKLISSDLCHSMRERNKMLETGALDGLEALVVGELGGGSGRLAEVFGLTTNYRYVIIDITPALYVSQWYIERRFPDEKIFVFQPFASFSEIEEELRESRFAFFTANQIELLPAKYFDLFVNVNSLMEMQHEQRTNFLAQIQRVTRSQFFSQQWFRWENPLDRVTVSKSDFTLGDEWTIAYEAANAIHSELFVQIWRRA
jgi:putative sugar O-methyltransferase